MTTNKIVGSRHGSAVITLPSDTEYLITRIFDAPAELIFKATTTPELVARWWGFETAEWLVCDIDLRVGGGYRYVICDRDMEVGFHGEYREIARPHRLVFTEMFEGVPVLPPPEAYPVITMTLKEIDGVTTMTLLAQHTTAEERDMVLESGMEGGMQVSYNRLEDLARELSAAQLVPGDSAQPQRGANCGSGALPRERFDMDDKAVVDR